MYVLPAERQKTLAEFKELEIILFTNKAYTKHQDIHDQESFKEVSSANKHFEKVQNWLQTTLKERFCLPFEL